MGMTSAISKFYTENQKQKGTEQQDLEKPAAWPGKE